MATSLARSIWCAAAFHASQRVVLASGKVQTMTDGSGPSSAGLFERLDALGSSLKTSVASSLCLLRAGLSVTWRERGTKSGLFYSEPTTSVRHTDGTGSGLSGDWPTPAAMNPNDGEGLDTWEARRQRVLATKKNGNGFGTPLAIAVRICPTPCATDCEAAGGPMQSSLTNSVTGRYQDGPPDPASPSTSGKPRDWCTPVAQPANGTPEDFLRRKRESVARGNSMGICISDLNMQVQQAEGKGSLNPAWVSQLQGFPDGWLDLPDEVLSRLLETR